MRRYVKRMAEDPEFAKYVMDKLPGASEHWEKVSAPSNKAAIEWGAKKLEAGHDMLKWYKKNPKFLIEKLK